MEYKVLIRLYVPEIEEVYEVYIPINKSIGEVVQSLNILVSSLSGIYPPNQNLFLYSRHTGIPYARNFLIRNTDIRNGSELILISSRTGC